MDRRDMLTYDIVVDFVAGFLVFQSYIYTTHISPFEDEYNTRFALLNSLAILCLIYNSVAIYKAFSPCNQDKDPVLYTFPKELVKHVEKDHDFQETKNNWKFASKQTHFEGLENCIYGVIECDSDFDVEEVNDKILSASEKRTLPSSHYVTIEVKQNKSLECSVFDYTSTKADKNVQHISTKITENPLKLAKRIPSVSPNHSVKTFISFLIDSTYIYVGLSALQVVTKYYHLYHWTFQYLDLLELCMVPLVVIFIQVSCSVGRILNKLFKVISPGSESVSGSLTKNKVMLHV